MKINQPSSWMEHKKYKQDSRRIYVYIKDKFTSKLDKASSSFPNSKLGTFFERVGLVVGDGGLAMYFLAMFSFLYNIPTPTSRVSCKNTSNKNTYC